MLLKNILRGPKIEIYGSPQRPPEGGLHIAYWFQVRNCALRMNFNIFIQLATYPQ